eukprot:gene13513-17246_t
MTEQLQMTRRTILAGAAFAGALTPILTATSTQAATAAAPAATGAAPVDIATLERVKVDLVAPPFVHAHDQVAKTGPRVVEFTMTIEEKKLVIDGDGTEVHAMTFNGSVPGPLMVVHENDY